MDNVLKKLEICQEIILKMHTDDESNRDAKKLKSDLQILLKVKENLKNSVIDIELLKKINFIYKYYIKWEQNYESV